MTDRVISFETNRLLTLEDFEYLRRDHQTMLAFARNRMTVTMSRPSAYQLERLSQVFITHLIDQATDVFFVKTSNGEERRGQVVVYCLSETDAVGLKLRFQGSDPSDWTDYDAYPF